MSRTERSEAQLLAHEAELVSGHDRCSLRFEELRLCQPLIALRL